MVSNAINSKLTIKPSGNSSHIISLITVKAPSVFSLPQRKEDFLALLKNLAEIFLLSTSEQVLKNVARSIKFLSAGDHARLNEAKADLKKLVSSIRNRILEHLTEQEETKDKNAGRRKSSRRQSSLRSITIGLDSNDDEDIGNESSKTVDHETALLLNLQRARIMAYSNIFADCLDDSNDSIEELCKLLSDEITQRLVSRKIITTPELIDHPNMGIWSTSDERLHVVTAGVVEEGLQLILAVTAQKLSVIIRERHLIVVDDEEVIAGSEDNEEDAENADNDTITTMRDRLISLVEQCYEQFLPAPNTYSKNQVKWADLVQESGGCIACDLRTLFPKEWSDAASPFLRRLAISEDSNLIGGYVRYIRLKEAEMVRSAPLFFIFVYVSIV